MPPVPGGHTSADLQYKKLALAEKIADPEQFI
jgi:hypothetical protein